MNQFCQQFFCKETLCSPSGVECYGSIKLDSDKCLIPCEGIHADVHLEHLDISKEENMEQFEKLMGNYEEYKRGYINDISYPTAIKGG